MIGEQVSGCPQHVVIVDYAVVLIELQSAIGLLQEVTILCKTI